MPTDPSDPSSPTPSTRLYQTTSDAPKGGGGGIFIVILLLLLLGGAAAYYFLVYKPGAVAAAALPSPTPVATRAPVAATPTSDIAGNPTYNGNQRAQYIKQADEAYSALADPKRQTFTDSLKAFLAAGGVSAASLTSKEAIVTRRDLVAKCQAANDDYEAFTKTQEQTYESELKKTPLIPNDVNLVLDGFKFKAQTEKNIQLRDLQRDSLKTSDDLLAYLDKTYGSWSVNAAQRLAFKSGTAGPFIALSKTYNDQAAAIFKLQNEIKATVDPDSTPPAASPANAAASPSASPAIAPAPNAAP